MTQPNTQPSTVPESDPHRPADDREEVYFNGSPKLRGEIFTFSIYALVGIGLAVGGYFGFRVAWWLGLALVLAGACMFFVPLILTKSVRYRISNYRVDVESGIFSRNIDTLELWHVEDIKLHQSLSDRILGVGRIIIVSADQTTPRLELRDLPDPRPLFEQMKQRIIAVKRQRGVIKVDVG